MSSCWQVSFYLNTDPTPEFEELLENFFEVNACSYGDDGTDEYTGYISGDFTEDELQSAAKKANITLPPYKTTRLESSNWLKDYVIKFAPFEVEDFLIYGVHEEQQPQTDKLPIKIYAATAFGSDHQTTRCCLKAISELFHAGFVAKNILDVGTGSGILSLAAAKLWKNQCRITAVDIDEESVWVTRQNALDNQLDSLISVEVSDGYQAEIVHSNKPYNLILANILARPLISMSSDLAQSLTTGGYCILSGFVDNQTEWVINEHTKQGLILEKIYEIDNWRAALMKKA